MRPRARLVDGPAPADRHGPLARDEEGDAAGVAHDLIHTYDDPLLARRGVAAADSYRDVAPSAPRALHMPSRIFTRLGPW